MAQAELCKLGVCVQEACTRVTARYLQTLYFECWAGGTIIMDGVANNLHVVLKQILVSKFNVKKEDEFLERSSKLHASLSICNNAIFNILQGKERSSETDDGQATAVWRGMPLTISRSLYCSFRRAAQPSSSWGDSRARHPTTG